MQRVNLNSEQNRLEFKKELTFYISERTPFCDLVLWLDGKHFV